MDRGFAIRVLHEWSLNNCLGAYSASLWCTSDAAHLAVIGSNSSFGGVAKENRGGIVVWDEKKYVLKKGRGFAGEE